MNILYTQAFPTTPRSTKPTAPTRVIVTEHEVMLGSAAALLAPPRETHRRRTVLAWFASLRREPRHHVQSRRDFTEHSRMAREMYRL
ncbi:hypothetical protein [Mycolicibacterium litorale]|uniref:Uncharacterized protein n=1 Tax=Mycolicibacterium litorale TaxID=758802 RepID=A0AAD1MTG9_9MYCO|nr:hypothetical protein [Mycolicibacterium litorale]MCV7415425.1 hypothetical protein [Mycolicibacterium litorale]TDY08680.1 hypothetical protein BCL50_0751 [Mycolicibacterium litorale]BBY16605.1 hypothetical protein MLIT_21970 [Mycolicibacterium litorale]